ncbi:hypothetical protein CYMTET_19495 [Cymbomonas tetramitiformis]|uniref:Uncharacterized protein n=1 Tax=Cymbomonas tetramitiformis TaxID=36881 RepID=A0AAE0G5W1_9CHLO|nr:hypothetical protein CYMTET_19495 [Cymbomonas tetramitiformis]
MATYGKCDGKGNGAKAKETAWLGCVAATTEQRASDGPAIKGLTDIIFGLKRQVQVLANCVDLRGFTLRADKLHTHGFDARCLLAGDMPEICEAASAFSFGMVENVLKSAVDDCVAYCQPADTTLRRGLHGR